MSQLHVSWQKSDYITQEECSQLAAKEDDIVYSMYYINDDTFTGCKKVASQPTGAENEKVVEEEDDKIHVRNCWSVNKVKEITYAEGKDCNYHEFYDISVCDTSDCN